MLYKLALLSHLQVEFSFALVTNPAVGPALLQSHGRTNQQRIHKNHACHASIRHAKYCLALVTYIKCTICMKSNFILRM